MPGGVAASAERDQVRWLVATAGGTRNEMVHVAGAFNFAWGTILAAIPVTR